MNCQHCKAPITNSNKKFCSTECKAESQRTGEQVICLTCKDTFYAQKGNPRKYCSDPCYYQSLVGRRTTRCTKCLRPMLAVGFQKICDTCKRYPTKENVVVEHRIHSIYAKAWM